MKKIFYIVILLSLALMTNPSFAENFTVKGDMASTLHYELQHQITAGDSMKK